MNLPKLITETYGDDGYLDEDALREALKDLEKELREYNMLPATETLDESGAPDSGENYEE